MDRHDVLPAVLAWTAFPFFGMFILAAISKLAHARNRIHNRITRGPL